MATLPRPLHAKHLGQSPQGLRRDGRRRGAHDLRPDPGHVRGQLDDVARMLAGQSPDVAAMLTDSAEDILAFRSFPTAQWRKIWSTHPLERVKREIKRRTNVVGIFPNDAAIVRLVTAVCVETHDEWAVSKRCYLSEESMAKIGQHNATDEDTPIAITA